MTTAGEEVEIVIVEDDPNDAELMMRVLRKHNWAGKCIWLKDGAEALAFFFAPGADSQPAGVIHPKVILLDLKLPKVNGLEVLQRLKSDERTREIPVVILTSSREEKDLEKGYALGVNSYLTKPINFDEFAKLVAELAEYWLALNRTFRR